MNEAKIEKYEATLTKSNKGRRVEQLSTGRQGTVESVRLLASVMAMVKMDDGTTSIMRMFDSKQVQNWKAELKFI